MRPSRDVLTLRQMLLWASVAAVIVAAVVAFFVFAPDVTPLARTSVV